MEELKVKNETIRNLNVSSVGINKIAKDIDILYGKSISDIAEIYRDKIFEYENMLLSNGETFYTNNILGQVLIFHFDGIITEASEEIRQFVDNISELPENYIFKKIILMLASNNIKEYEKLCKKLKSFSLDKDLKNCIYKFFKTRQFYLYEPGWFIKTYSNLKDILIKLGINIDQLDKTVEPIVKDQECNLEIIRDVAKMQTGSESENDIKDYINKMAEDLKKEINGKRKKHV